MRFNLKNIIIGTTLGIIGAGLGYHIWKTQMGPIPYRTLFSDGTIPVLMYHHIDNDGNRFSINPKTLETQLSFLYDHGFRIISPGQLVSGNYDTQKPLLITFDDSTDDQFQLEGGKPTLDSAVGVLTQFYTKHPDFGQGIVFYVDYVKEDSAGEKHPSFPFGDERSVQRKLRFLEEHGFVIGNHTYLHPNLTEVLPEDLECEIATLEGAIQRRTDTFAYPYGRAPENAESLRDLSHFMTSAFTCENDLAIPSSHSDFDALHIPRIEMNQHSMYTLAAINAIVDSRTSGESLKTSDTLTQGDSDVIIPRKPVILDPGHGGVQDSGTAYLGEPTEDEITYDITVRVRELLLAQGYHVHQTIFDRTTAYQPPEQLHNGTSEFLNYGEGTQTHLSHRFMTKRCELIDETYVEEDPIQVSIHVNYEPTSLTRGAIFYYPSSSVYHDATTHTESLSLAKALQESYKVSEMPTHSLELKGIDVDFLAADIYGRVPGDGFSPFNRTRHSKKVLIEVGNVKNPADKELLLNSDGRQRIAEAIYLGIVTYDQQN